MFKLLYIFIVMALLLMVAAPALAQETAPVAVDGQVYLVDDLVVIGTLFVILALLVVLSGAIVANYRSAPPWMKDIIKPLADIALTKAEEVSKKTDNPIDDKLVAAIRSIAEEVLALDRAERVKAYTDVSSGELPAVYG